MNTQILNHIKMATHQAYLNALATGLDVLICEGKNIYAVNNKGKKELLKTLLHEPQKN